MNKAATVLWTQALIQKATQRHIPGYSSTQAYQATPVCHSYRRNGDAMNTRPPLEQSHK